jgi:IS5 family transposase
MSARSKGPRLGDYFMGRRRTSHTFLDEIDAVIDWLPIQAFLTKKLKRKANAVGNPAYPPLPMFKILLLQRWYNLSDQATEQALLDRLSFIRFTGFSFEDDVPDETTICRFRNGLIRLGLLDKLLEMINGQIEARGLLVREGAVVDASVVESSRRPRKVIDVMPEDRAEGDEGLVSDEPMGRDENQEPTVRVSYSDDEAAAWLRKGRRAHYGYKVHVATDSRDGFLLGGHVTPANKSDTGEFERLLDTASMEPGAYVFADKGYASFTNREALRQRNLKDGTMDKATRSGPLTEFERTRNRLISSVRQLVERAFGTLKRNYGFARSRYVGQDKVEGEFHLLAMAFNIKKAVLLAHS